MSDLFREGDFYRTDDRTGRKVRASRTRKEWNGSIVDKDWYEPRQPQDFVHGKIDRQTVPNPRPEPTPTYIGPLTSTLAAAATAGATSLTLASSVRMEAGDILRIMLDNNDSFRVAILNVVDDETVTIVSPLPYSAAIGNLVVDATAMAQADLP